MKIDNAIQNTSFTPTVPSTTSESSATSSSAPETGFANVLEQTKQAAMPSTRITKSGDTLIGIVRDEAKSKGINLSGAQEYRLAMSLAAHNGIANPNQIATGRALQMDKLGTLLEDLPNLNTALA